MKKSLLILFLLIVNSSPLLSQSNLLERVKNNPNDSIKMCKKFQEYNSNGVLANSDEFIEYVSKKNNLTPINAEIYSIYVIGLHCPEII